MESARWREAPWGPAAGALAAVSAALALSLELPRLFSDPNGLDPDVLRLAGVSAALALASLGRRRLAPARPVLLSVAAVSISFSAFSLTPGVLRTLSGGSLGGDEQLLGASGIQAGITLLIALVVLRGPVAARLRPDLRLRGLGLVAALATVAGIGLLVPAGLAIPAGWLGREGIAVQAVSRDLPWLAPACLLQAFAQEVQFRGLLLGTLERVAPPAAANLAQATLFALAHLAIQYPGPVGPFIPVTLAFGLAFGWLTRRTGSLWPAVLIHAAADIAITVTVLPGLYGT